MSFLDTGVVHRDDARVITLHDIMIRAYPSRVDALAIAGSVGILQADIAIYPKMRHTWWSILEEAAEDYQMRRLVHNVLDDPTIQAFHNDIRDLLDIPENELAIAAVAMPDNGGLRPKIGDGALLWPIGKVLKVRFLDGDPVVHAKVEEAALQWVDYANLWLDFGNHADAEIRISFQKLGSWSYVGTNCQLIADPEPNVNFGWLTSATSEKEVRRVVLHEFGHVLGMQHEQGNPASTIKWNKDAVYASLGGPPNNWSRAQIDRAFFTIWPPGYYPVHKVFDPASITMLPIPAEYLQEGMEIGWNAELSALDKQFAAALYPQRERIGS